MSAVAPSIRTTVRRLPERGVYDRAVIEAILDEGLLCHVGFAVEGQPYVIPCVYARIGDRVYLHGSSGSRMLRAIVEHVVPLALVASAPIADAELREGIAAPAHARCYLRPREGES
jgi:hypothetical protein